MDKEAVLLKVGAYAAEHVGRLRQALDEAERTFQKSPLPDKVTIAHPVSVADILADWHLPASLIETVVWSAAFHHKKQNELVPILGESRARLAFHLLNFMDFLAECREKKKKNEIDHTLLGRFWKPGFVVLVVGMFLDTIRRAAATPEAADKKELASQVRDVFGSIVLEHLGLRLVHHELYDLAFQCEDPEKFAKVQELVPTQQKLAPVIERIEWLVWDKASEYGITDLQWKYHIIHPSQMKKLYERGSRAGAHDCISFVALLPDEEACYRFLHPLDMVGSVSGPLKDYATHPKSSGYRSLHSRITIAPYGPINFYIRTPEWDEESDFGLLSRLRHGESSVFDEAHLLPRGKIFVYTQQGKPYLLPSNATPVDLAYSMGEVSGHRFSRAYVFGKGYVESDSCLEDGDIVEIERQDHAEPDLEWLKFVKTESAKRALRLWKSREGAPPSSSSRLEDLKDITESVKVVIISPELQNMHCHRCDRCKPHPPQDICAYPTQHGTLTIHHSDCHMIHDRMQTIPVAWRENHLRATSHVFHIEALDHKGLLRQILDKISPEPYNANMVELYAKSYEDWTVHFKIAIEEEDPQTIEKIYQALKEIEEIYNITRDQPKYEGVSASSLSSSWAKLLNPYTPLPASREMFFGRRSELLQIWRVLQSGRRQNSILIWGQPRIGLTSLLKHLELRAHSQVGYLPVYMTLSAWWEQKSSERSDLVLWFVHQVEQRLAREAVKYDFYLPIFDRYMLQTEPQDTLVKYFTQLCENIAPRKLMVMVDQFQRLNHMPGEQVELLIKCLENLLEACQEISFLFANGGLKDRSLQGIQVLAVDMPLRVLDAEAAENLIRIPVGPFTYEEGVIDEIRALTNGHPYYIHLLCKAMVDEAIDDASKHVLTRKDLDSAVEKLLHSNTGSFGQLLAAVPKGEIVLEGLARVPASEDGYVDFVALARRLRSWQADISEGHLSRVLKDLSTLEVVQQEQNENDAVYRISLPLLRKCIKLHPLYP